MTFTFRPLEFQDLEAISKWKYHPDDDPFYLDPYMESHRAGKEMRGPKNCQGFVCLGVEREVAGLFEYSFDDQEIMEIGCAFHPDYKGKGLGKEFVLQGISFGVKHFNYGLSKLKLVVSLENHAAIAVYRKCGFTKVEDVEEWGEPSMVMELELNE